MTALPAEEDAIVSTVRDLVDSNERPVARQLEREPYGEVLRMI